MTEIRACCPTRDDGPHVPSCAEHVPPQGRQREPRFVLKDGDRVVSGPVAPDASGTVTFGPEHLHAPVPHFATSVDVPSTGGVWVTYYRDGDLAMHTNVTPHPDELTALRALNQSSGLITAAIFVPYGTELDDAIKQLHAAGQTE
jgi:hypothetical protein